MYSYQADIYIYILIVIVYCSFINVMGVEEKKVSSTFVLLQNGAQNLANVLGYSIYCPRLVNGLA